MSTIKVTTRPRGRELADLAERAMAGDAGALAKLREIESITTIADLYRLMSEGIDEMSAAERDRDHDRALRALDVICPKAKA